MATVSTERRMTLDDLSAYDGKAELISGRIVPQMPTGRRPSLIAGEIYSHLKAHVATLGVGEVYTDNIGFAVPELASGRESFSPDVSYFAGPFADDDAMDFVAGAPTFAVEVRSKSDHGPAAEREMASKRADYFEAGTLVVWDVDPVARCVRVYRPEAPEVSTTFAEGQEADAEPAVPGWRLDLAWSFR